MSKNPLAQVDIRRETRAYNSSDLQAILDKISFENSILDFQWRYRFRPYRNEEGEAEGWLLWVEFMRPDIHTGEMGWGRGRDEVIRVGAYEGSVVKTAWVLFRMVVEHEMMEGFQYEGSRIFNPHRTIPELQLPDHVLAAQRRDEANETDVRNSVPSVSA